MASEWDRGVLTASSWHRLETVGAMADAGEMIASGEKCGAWPTSIAFDSLQTPAGLVAPARAVVGSYAGQADRCLGVVGDRYNATTPEGWRSLVNAACAAGAKPTGAFSLRGGSRVLATFEVGKSNGIKTHLVLADAFDGTMRLSCGKSSVRVVCANTLSAAMSADGKGFAMLRHTSSLEAKVSVLAEAIADAVRAGDTVRHLYEQAEQTSLSREQAEQIFDRLFPSAPKDADKRTVTTADNARADARRAMARGENYAGCTLATLWNGATWLVDREANGQARKVRGGGESIDSMLFGTRGERVSEVQTLIEVILRDGTVETVSVPDALVMGADKFQVGRKVLDEMLADLG